MSADGMQIVMTAAEGPVFAGSAEEQAKALRRRLDASEAENARLRTELDRRGAAFTRCRDRLAIELDRGDRLADALALAGQALEAMAASETVLEAVARKRVPRWQVSQDGDVSEQVPF